MAKKAKREEHVAVCVVQRRACEATPLTDHVLLLAKRPEQGLLAGLWEFPSVSVAAEASADDRRQALDSLLDDMGLGGVVGRSWRVVHRRDVGSVMHIFSHIRMTLHVEHLLVEGDAQDIKTEGGGSMGESQELTWVTHKALCEGGHKLSGAPSKVFATVNARGSKGSKVTKGGAKENARITSFFTKANS